MGCSITKPDMCDEIYCYASWQAKNYDEVNYKFTDYLSKIGIVVNARLLATIVTAIINGNYKTKAEELIVYRANYSVIRTAFISALDDAGAIEYWMRCFDKLIAHAIVATHHQRRTTFSDF